LKERGKNEMEKEVKTMEEERPQTAEEIKKEIRDAEIINRAKESK